VLPQDSKASTAGATGESEDAEAEARRLQREAERARHGTFLFGCDSELSQGTRAVPYCAVPGLLGGVAVCVATWVLNRVCVLCPVTLLTRF
jgi:hypothetical protein